MNQLVARRTFSTEYDGETIQITAGRTRIAPDHPLASENPDAWKPVRGQTLTRRDGSEYRGIDHDGQRKALYTGEQVADAVEEITDEQRAYLQRQYERGSFESGAEFPVPGRPTPAAGATTPRDEALRAVDARTNDGTLNSRAADSIESVIRRDSLGVDAEYIAAVSDPLYEEGFRKLLMYGDGAVLRMSPEEQKAVQRVAQAESVRAMLEGTGSAGGWGLPIAVDPSIQLSSNGSINPVRELASVRTMTTRELRLVASDGTTASYAAEGAEVGDNSPTLTQPVLTAQRAHSFIPFSYELGDDWSSLRQELQKLLADAKDQLEVEKFLTGAGAGSNEPVGLLSIGTSGSLTTSQRVQTGSVATLAATDAYLLKQALPARFIPNASFVFHPNTLDSFYRFVGGGGSEPPLMVERDGKLLGKTAYEWSTLGTGTTTGTKLGVYGDFSKFVIGDRAGLSVELVGSLVGPNHRPVGMRGIYAIWRNDSRVAVPNAFRYLEVK
ncbi:MAG: phage major capsid protein [Thermoleophilaceae bacterium]